MCKDRLFIRKFDFYCFIWISTLHNINISYQFYITVIVWDTIKSIQIASLCCILAAVLILLFKFDTTFWNGVFLFPNCHELHQWSPSQLRSWNKQFPSSYNFFFHSWDQPSSSRKETRKVVSNRADTTFVAVKSSI